MKSYYDFMNEFDQDDILEGLINYGLFSDKLPPIFDGQSFYEYCKNNTPLFANTSKESNYIKYETMRNINLPRHLGIPNPMNYYKLCSFISSNWDSIKEHFKKQTQNQKQKVSRIHIRKMKDEKTIFQMNYKNYRADGPGEVDFLLGAKYVVNADISTCFPSMYTHSLPWALVGRNYAKKNRDKHHWFNQLDFYVRGTTNGETHGILIGPHASNILSEIILVCIDSDLVDKGWKYIRNIDDYTCYVSSYEDAQRFLVDINDALKKYNLMLNHKKTKVLVLPLTSTQQWVRKLSVLPTSNASYLNYKDLKVSMDTAIELLHSNDNNAAILNYLIKVVSRKELSKSAKQYYIKNILHLSIIFPYLIPLLDTYIFESQDVEKSNIEQFANVIYQDGLKTNNFEMVCYSLFFALKYKFKIQTMKFEEIRNSTHCILMLLGYLYSKNIKKDKHEIKLYKKLAKELIQDEDDFDEYWIFVYEVLTVGQLKSDWKLLKQNKVSFLKVL